MSLSAVATRVNRLPMRGWSSPQGFSWRMRTGSLDNSTTPTARTRWKTLGSGVADGEADESSKWKLLAPIVVYGSVYKSPIHRKSRNPKLFDRWVPV